MTRSAPRRRHLSRRMLVIFFVLALLCGGIPVIIGTWLLTGATNTVGKVSFSNRLAIPPLAASHLDASGTRVFDLNVTAGHHQFGSGQSADTLGYNGDYLGPTLRASQGEQVLVNVHNGLNESTTVHWHGMHLPAVMDGGPHQLIAAGTDWQPTWKIDQPATTLWYHPHPHGETAEQVYKGLAGFFILDDPRATALNLPGRYGVDDLPLAVQDKAFDGKNALDDSNSLFSGNGILGNQIVVNGTLDPYVDVSTELVRLRLLNASNARTFDFGFDDDRSFAMIGSDGGLLTSPYTTNRIMLTPGERAEIVVKVAPGERTVLRSYPPKLDGGVLNDRFSGGKDRFDVLQLRGAATLTASPALPSQLTTITRLDPARAATTRKLSMGENQINQLKMDMSRVDATVTVGTTEVWELSNLDSAPHNFHIHDVQFQVVSIGGAAPGPELMGWKDTMLVRPGVVTRIVMAFTDYADAHHAYMFHCHLLFHEDQGMMGQFVIVEPGQQASLDPDHQHS